jgi:hypothetical protein
MFYCYYDDNNNNNEEEEEESDPRHRLIPLNEIHE